MLTGAVIISFPIADDRRIHYTPGNEGVCSDGFVANYMKFKWDITQ